MACPSFAAESATDTSVNDVVSADLRQRAVDALRRALREEPRWVKVHAAEFLLALDYPEDVTRTFQEELDRTGNEPEYRVGIWRVLSRAEHNPIQRAQWIDRIRGAFLDEQGPDRLHAIETLAKLAYVTQGSDDDRFSTSDDPQVDAYLQWIRANDGTQDHEHGLADLLQSENEDVRQVAGYGLGFFLHASPETSQALLNAADNESAESSASVYLLSSAWIHAPVGRRPEIKTQLLEYLRSNDLSERYEVCNALAKQGAADDVPTLVALLDDPEADVRSAAAHAILRIGRRGSHRLATLDWTIIGMYLLGMLGVGWYYSRHTETTEDYMLGGRKMNPLAVGLSMFASLLSTITYLALPGEMIHNGPMILCELISYPFVIWIVGWFLIPFIMKLRVTSAYEILEVRLGLSVRMLGSVFFVSLRLLWMAVIVYATTGKVLVPLLGIDPSWTPYLCAGLSLITVVYTAMGGLKAVVLTDVLQTAILLGGAILSLVLITRAMGGVGTWWPTCWEPTWQDPVLVYAPGSTRTLLGIVAAQLTWYVCTSGSDQIAIQRFMATRNVAAARRTLMTSMAASAVVLVFLAMLGLALQSYFRGNPHMIPDGQTLASGADQLFPQFIVFGLPVGISGLVLAGLLAAAMSSLSSGVNSTCAVVTVDFIDRFRRTKDTETDHVRLARYVSVGVGVLVVVLSSLVGLVQGNLLEVAFKVVNLLVAPLFGLFFMAMFVRWATSFGTIAGAMVGLTVAVAINYWREITGTVSPISFFYAMPLSLVAQVAVGMVFSLLPIGRRPENLVS